jgi:CMP/dCMP kinase
VQHRVFSDVTRDKLIVAIDGPSAAGKTSAARMLAKRLGYLYLDSGALYRAIAWKVSQSGLDPKEEQRLSELLSKTEIRVEAKGDDFRVRVDDSDVTSHLRAPAISRLASQVSGIRAVREKLLQVQRQLGGAGGVVVEGRDIGTVVFPSAHVKFYLDATPHVRGNRRYQELKEMGHAVNENKVLEEMRIRDEKDSRREIAPLKKADDAFVLDSTGMALEEVVNRMMAVVQKKFA